MTKSKPTPKAITAPKGRPTRSSRGRRRRGAAFGPTAQWIAIAVVIVAALVIAAILLDGGDFNPLNNGT